MSKLSSLKTIKFRRKEINILLSIAEKLNVNPIKKATFTPFYITDKNVNQRIGYIQSTLLDNLLNNFGHIFQVSMHGHEKIVTFTNKVDNSLESRTSILQEVSLNLKNKGIINDWRDELMPIATAFSASPVLLIERAASPFFGFKGYGVHVNGYVSETNSNGLSVINGLWVGRRSPNKSTFPGMLDHIAAGGQPYGIGLLDNVIKECKEEANIEEIYARNAKPVGAVNYNSIDANNCLKRDVLFCYDLELPKSFIPTPHDGEVESFELKDIDWIVNNILDEGPRSYKPNCKLVVIDFLIRHGIIDPESDGYLELIASLRTDECS